MIAPALLLLTVAAVLVDCRPQNNFLFPENAANATTVMVTLVGGMEDDEAVGRVGEGGLNAKPAGEYTLVGPPRFPLQRVQSNNRIPPRGFSPQMPSQPFSFGNQQFPTRNPAVMPTSTTTGQPNVPESTSASTTSDGTPTVSTLPPINPGNRIIYIIPSNCDCPFTAQYSPVCGTNGQTYANFGILSCNKECGVDVDVYLMGACARSG